MFERRSTIHAVTSVLVALCYLALAGISAVHEVTHVTHSHGASSVSATIVPSMAAGHSDDDSSNHTSLPCFLCLTGQPYSTVHSPTLTDDIVATESEERIAPVPGILCSSFRLPSLRAPPSLS